MAVAIIIKFHIFPVINYVLSMYLSITLWGSPSESFGDMDMWWIHIWNPVYSAVYLGLTFSFYWVNIDNKLFYV